MIAFGGAVWRNTTKEVTVTEHTTEELLLAGELFRRAEHSRNTGLARERARLGLRIDESSDELTKWERENSLQIHLERALADLMGVADFIRTVRKK